MFHAHHNGNRHASNVICSRNRRANRSLFLLRIRIDIPNGCFYDYVILTLTITLVLILLVFGWSEWCEKATLCQHAEYLLLNEADYFSDSLWDLNSAQICRCLDDVTLPEPACPVSLIGETEWGLLASVALNRNNFPRNTVLCNKSRYVQCLDCKGASAYKCQHSRFFSNWLAKDCNDTYLKQRLGEWTLREESQLQHKLHDPAQSAWRHTVGAAQVGQGPVDPQSMPLVEMTPRGMPYPSPNDESSALKRAKKDSPAVNDAETRVGRESTSSAEDASSCQVINLGITIQKEGDLCTKETRDGVESNPGSSSHQPVAFAASQSPAVIKCNLPEITRAATPIGRKKKSQESRKILPNVLEKRCNKCGAVKRASAYYRDGKDETGLQRWCRACCLRHGPRAHERLAQRSQKKLRQLPRAMAAGVSGQNLPKCTYGALGNQCTYEISSDSVGREGILMPSLPLDPGVTPYMPALSPCTLRQLELKAMNVHPSSVEPMQVINPNSFPQVCGTSPRNGSMETTPFHLYGFQSDDVRLVENKGNPLVPFVMDIKEPVVPVQDPTFHQDSMAVKEIHQPTGTSSVFEEYDRRLQAARSNLLGMQMPVQGQWGPVGLMGSAPLPGVGELMGGSIGSQNMAPRLEHPGNLAPLGTSPQGAAGLQNEYTKGLQFQAAGLDAVRLQQEYSMEKEGQLSEAQMPSTRVNGLNYISPGRGLLSVSPGFQHVNNNTWPIQMNFFPEHVPWGNVPCISLKADEDQPDYCSSWIGTPDSDSMGTQGSGSREWSTQGGSHTATNSHGSETNLKEVGKKTRETSDELFSNVNAAHTQGMTHVQKDPLQELQGSQSQCLNTIVSQQQHNYSLKRKPLVARKVPSFFVPPGSDATTPDMLHGSSVQASYHPLKRQRYRESRSCDVLDSGSTIGAYSRQTEEAKWDTCSKCGIQLESICHMGLCTTCFRNPTIMKASHTCGPDKGRQKFTSMQDSCPDRGPESFLPVPSQEVVPSDFLSGDIVAADDDNLPDPAGDTGHDDGHFATLAFFRHNSDHSFAGHGVMNTNYSTQAALEI